MHLEPDAYGEVDGNRWSLGNHKALPKQFFREYNWTYCFHKLASLGEWKPAFTKHVSESFGFHGMQNGGTAGAEGSQLCKG
jgi:hypothetical protein